MVNVRPISLVSLMALGFAMPAMAQTPEQTAGPQQVPAAEEAGPQQVDRQRDVVVVTAQKREETVQDIAIAVTAITSELRDEIGLTSVQDYTNFAPGLSYSTANDRLGLRGVTRTSNNFGIRSGISNYVDGVYVSTAIPAGRPPLFVERVEVVRGPQGTLYGRDSIGGALNLISKRPTEDFEGQFNMGAGNYDSQKVELTVAGPITDWLRYRVGGARISQGEGFLRNASGGETEGLRNDEYYLEAQLEGQLGDRFDWWMKTSKLQWDRLGTPGARTSVDAPYPYETRFFTATSNIAPNAWFGLSDPNRVQVGTQNTNPSITDRYAFNTDFSNIARLRGLEDFTLEAIYHADAFDIKYLGGYVSYNYNLQQDHDGSPIKRFNTTPTKTIFTDRVSDYTENRSWFSNEINFVSTWDSPFQLVAGLYQYQENYNQTVFVSQIQNPGGPIYDLTALQTWLTVGGPLTGAAPPPRLAELPTANGRNVYSGSPIKDASLNFFTNNAALNHAYGAFAQADYQLNDQLKFTAGIRWSKDISDGREYARIVNHYVLEAALEPAFIAGYTPLVGGNAALAAGIVQNATPVRIDVTRNLPGVDPSTGRAGFGIINVAPVAAANGVANCALRPAECGVYFDPVSGNGFRDFNASWEEITGVLGVDWTPDADTLIYGKYNRGYKPGGFGAADVFGILAPTPYTDQEIVDAVEVGFKRDWRDWNLTTNAVAFYYDYSGYQVANLIVPEPPSDPLAVRANPYTSYVNLPETTISGLELETIWYPTDNLRIIANYGYTNPEIGQSPALVHALDPYALDPAAQPLGTPATRPATCPNAPPANGSAPVPATTTNCRGLQGQNLDGNILPFSPKNKAAINGTYTWYYEDGSTLDASLSYLWQDIAFTSIFNRSYTKTPSWDQVDARLSWTNADGNITLIGFVRNMLDEIVYDAKGAGLREGTFREVSPTECFSTPTTSPAFGTAGRQSCYTRGETLRPPRTYGAELQFRF